MPFIPYKDITLQNIGVSDSDDLFYDFELLTFVGYDICDPTKIIPLENTARGITNVDEDRVDSLISSFVKGWKCGSYPIPCITTKNGRYNFDGRHTLDAAKKVNAPKIPCAFYDVNKDHKYCHLSDDVILICASVYANNNNGIPNNVTATNFIYALIECFLRDDNLAKQQEAIELTYLMGAKDRYVKNHVRQTKSMATTAIREYNSLKNYQYLSAKSVKNNATADSVRKALKNTKFHKNHVGKESNIVIRKVSSNANDKYIDDILRQIYDNFFSNVNRLKECQENNTTFTANVKKFVLYSGKSSAPQIANERADFTRKFDEHWKSCFKFFSHKFGEVLNSSMMDQLKMQMHHGFFEMYYAPEIEGEIEPNFVKYTY